MGGVCERERSVLWNKCTAREVQKYGVMGGSICDDMYAVKGMRMLSRREARCE